MKFIIILIAAYTLCFADGVISDDYPLLQNIMDYSLYNFEAGIYDGNDEIAVSYQIPEREFRSGFIGYKTKLSSEEFEQVAYDNSLDYSIHKDKISSLFRLNLDINRYNVNEYLKYKESLDSLVIENSYYRNIAIIDYFQARTGLTTNFLKRLNKQSSLILSLIGQYDFYNGYSYDERISKSYSGKYDYIDIRYDNYDDRRSFFVKFGLGLWHKFNGKRRKHQMLLNTSYSYSYDTYHPEIIDGLTGYANITNEDLPVTNYYDGLNYGVHNVNLSLSVGEQNPEFIGLVERYKLGWLKAKFAFKKAEISVEYKNIFGQFYSYYTKDYNTYSSVQHVYEDQRVNLILDTEFRVYLFKRFFIDANIVQNFGLYNREEFADYITWRGIGSGGFELVKKERIVMEFGVRIPGIVLGLYNSYSFDFNVVSDDRALFFNLHYLVGRKNAE